MKGKKTKAETRESKKKIKMKVSGKSVLKLKKIINNKNRRAHSTG
jgi:hypothetical protein